MSVPSPLTLAQLGVLLALAFGFLAWLHLRTPRSIRTRVPFLAAWDEVAPRRAASPARWAFRRSWALVRAILFVALLGIALLDPQPSWLVGPSRTTLIVLDAGAHMGAIDEQPSRFERARELAATTIAQRVATEDIMVVQLDSALTPLSGWSRNATELQAALGQARLSQAPTRFDSLRAFAGAGLRDKPNLQVILFSDGAFETEPRTIETSLEPGIALRHVRVGRSAKNLAIRAFSVRAYPWDAERCEAMVQVENTDAQPQAAELTLFEESKPIDVQPLRVPAGSRERYFFALGATRARFSALLAPQNQAANEQRSDDRAYAVLSQPAVRRVLLVTRGQRYLESALALDSRLRVEKRTPEAYRSANGYDVAIFDRFVPSEPPGIPALWLAPTASASSSFQGPYPVAGSIDRPFFDEVATDNPLLRSVSLRDVNIRKAQRAQLQPEDVVLARSKLGPLIVRGERAGQPFIALTFDARESDLVLRTAWPIFLIQAVRQLTAATDAVLEEPLRAGSLQTREVAATTGQAVLEAPTGGSTRLEIRAKRVRFTLDEPGFYELAAGGTTQLMAANPDPGAASTIAPTRVAPAPKRSPGLAVLWPRRYGLALLLLAAALLLLGVDAHFTARGSGR